jgi:hypothetical protein
MKRMLLKILGLVAATLAATLATSCTAVDYYGPHEARPYTAMGKKLAEIPGPTQLGSWQGNLLVYTTGGGRDGIAMVDSASGTVTRFYSSGYMGAYEFAVLGSKVALLSHDGRLFVYDLQAQKVNALYPSPTGPQQQLTGSPERIFIGYSYIQGYTEIVEGSSIGSMNSHPRYVSGIATQGASIFLTSEISPRYVFITAPDVAMDSVNLGALLQDTLFTIQQMVAHGGNLFVQGVRKRSAPLQDTAYIAVLNTATWAIEKTIGLGFSLYDNAPPQPRVTDGRWYLCGLHAQFLYQIKGVEVVDLNARTYEGPLVFNEPVHDVLRDFTAIDRHHGYVINASDYAIQKVTF